jgi:hypothetical protein
VHGSVFFGITEIEGGFPHSEIRGSKVVRTSPRLIAAYHVLHRLSAPRHPPDTLKALDRSHYRRPPNALASGRNPRRIAYMRRFERPFASNMPESYAVCTAHAGRSLQTFRKISLPKARCDRTYFLFTMTDSDASRTLHPAQGRDKALLARN